MKKKKFRDPKEVRKILKAAELNGVAQTAKDFKVAPSQIYGWRSKSAPKKTYNKKNYKAIQIAPTPTSVRVYMFEGSPDSIANSIRSMNS